MSSVFVLFAAAVTVVVLVDARLVYVGAMRGVPREKLAWCVLVGATVGALQIAGVVLTGMEESPIYVDSSQVPWAFPILGILSAVVLLVSRRSRPFGWAVLLGTIEGFVGLIAFFVALLIACDCLE
jgi:hypothetical protein